MYFIIMIAKLNFPGPLLKSLARLRCCWSHNLELTFFFFCGRTVWHSFRLGPLVGRGSWDLETHSVCFILQIKPSITSCPSFFDVKLFTFTAHSIKTPPSQKIRLMCITAAVSFSLTLLIASFGQWELSRTINQLLYLITSRCTSRLQGWVVFEPSWTHHCRYESSTAS